MMLPWRNSTISSRIYQYAQSQRIPDCAVWVLCQALLGIYPLVLLARWADSPKDRAEPRR